MMKYEKYPNMSMLKLVVSVIFLIKILFFYIYTGRECAVYLQ